MHEVFFVVSGLAGAVGYALVWWDSRLRSLRQSTVTTTSHERQTVRPVQREVFEAMESDVEKVESPNSALAGTDDHRRAPEPQGSTSTRLDPLSDEKVPPIPVDTPALLGRVVSYNGVLPMPKFTSTGESANRLPRRCRDAVRAGVSPMSPELVFPSSSQCRQMEAPRPPRERLRIIVVVDRLKIEREDVLGSDSGKKVDLRTVKLAVLGDENKTKTSTKYVIRKVEVELNDFFENLSSSSRHALGRLVESPKDHDANREFRGSLFESSEMKIPVRQERMLTDDESVGLGDCDVVVQGNGNSVRSESRHVIKRATMPLGVLLKNHPNLVTKCARALADPEFRNDFANEVEKVAKAGDVATWLECHDLLPAQLSPHDQVDSAVIGRRSTLSDKASARIGTVEIGNLCPSMAPADRTNPASAVDGIANRRGRIFGL